MTNLMKSTAALSLIALMTAAPVAHAAGTPTQSSSPQLSVANDPQEPVIEGNTNLVSEAEANLIKSDDGEGGAAASTDHSECLNNLVKEDDGECSS